MALSGQEQNHTHEQEDRSPNFESWLAHPDSLAQVSLKTAVSCLAVLGNGMVIAVILAGRRVFNSFTKRLILHQSIIDAIAGAVFFCSTVLKTPSSVVVSVHGTIADEFVCRVLFTDYPLWGLNVASTYNIVIISTERLMVTYPSDQQRQRRWTTQKSRRIAILTPWIVGFVYSSHLMFLVKPVQGHCQFLAFDHAIKVGLGVVIFSIELLLPIAIMAYSYGKILVLLKKLPTPINAKQRINAKIKKKVTLTVFIIVIMMVVCWTPSVCYYVGTLLFDKPGNELLYNASTLLLSCNLFVNPIICTLFHSPFRAQIRQLIIDRCRRRNRVQNINNI